MRVVLEVRQVCSSPISLKRVNLSDLFHLSTEDIMRLPLSHLGQHLMVGDVFKADIRDSDSTKWCYAEIPRCLVLRAWHRTPAVVVEGDAGAYTGLEVSGGELVIQGNAGDCLGVAMSGGKISVLGDTGDWCGAPKLVKARA